MTADKSLKGHDVDDIALIILFVEFAFFIMIAHRSHRYSMAILRGELSKDDERVKIARKRANRIAAIMFVVVTASLIIFMKLGYV
jgi:hypothetical protein